MQVPYVAPFYTLFILYGITGRVGGLVSIKTKFDRKVSGKSGTSRLNFAIEEHWFDMRSKSYIHI